MFAKETRESKIKKNNNKKKPKHQKSNNLNRVRDPFVPGRVN